MELLTVLDHITICAFFGSVDLRAFLPCPADFHLRLAPRIFILVLSRPTALENALPRTSPAGIPWYNCFTPSNRLLVQL